MEFKRKILRRKIPTINFVGILSFRRNLYLVLCGDASSVTNFMYKNYYIPSLSFRRNLCLALCSDASSVTNFMYKNYYIPSLSFRRNLLIRERDASSVTNLVVLQRSFFIPEESVSGLLWRRFQRDKLYG